MLGVFFFVVDDDRQPTFFLFSMQIRNANVQQQQKDGNLVLKNGQSVVVWNTNSAVGESRGPFTLYLQV